MPSQRSNQPGLALPPMRNNELIEYILETHQAPTTLIICSTREAFLPSLQESLQANISSSQEDQTKTAKHELHPLLIPTIHQLASSKTIQVVFTPTLQHLRAYLASYTPTQNSIQGSKTFTKPGSRRTPTLAIYGLLALHRATTEHSVQGLSRSLAVAVEAANYWGMRLVLTEGVDDLRVSSMEPVSGDETVSVQGCWEEQVPLLNSSLALSIGRAGAGRTVAVGAVIGKWCRVVRD